MIIVRSLIIVLVFFSMAFAGSKKDCERKIDDKIRNDSHWTKTEYYVKGDRVSRGSYGKIEYTGATEELDGYICDKHDNIRRVHGTWHGMGRMRVYDDNGKEYIMDVDENDNWEDDE